MSFFVEFSRALFHLATGCFPARRSYDHRLHERFCLEATRTRYHEGIRDHFFSCYSHDVPWEILLAICEQADTATLVRLCRVSFGMLELAGPILCEHVTLYSSRAIRQFFIEPSSTLSSCRLRPLLGANRLRSLHIDYRPTRGDRSESQRLPALWDLPNRRISSPISIDTLIMEGPKDLLSLGEETYQAIFRLLDARRTIVIHQASRSRQPVLGTIDLEVTTTVQFPTASRNPSIFVLRFLNLPLKDIVSASLLGKKGGASTSTHVMRVDFRRLASPASLPGFHFALGVCLANLALQMDSVVQLDFLVGSQEVAHVVEKDIASFPVEDSRKSRCFVIVG